MVKVVNTVGNTVSNQLPSHVVESHPAFVEFLEAYYNWMEEPGCPYHVARNHLSALDFKTSIEGYVDHIKHEYLDGVPDQILANKELFIRYSKSFHSARGTEQAFKFLFKVLFNEEIEIYYPRDNILRTSDGKWVDDAYQMLVTDTGNVDNLLNRRISQNNEVSPGVFQKSYATVDKVKKRIIGKYKVAELYVSDVDGTFSTGAPIENSDNEYEYLYDSVVSVDVSVPGSNYVTGNTGEIQVAAEYVLDKVATVDDGDTIDFQVSTLFDKSEIVVEVNTVPLADQDYVWDGRHVQSASIDVGDTVVLKMPSYVGKFHVSEVNANDGILSVDITEKPIGITTSYNVVMSGGTGATVTTNTGTAIKLPGHYKNNDGHLSSTMVIQDSHYYQNFSYVIKANRYIDEYKDVVLTLLHPAGQKMFGEVNIFALINLMITDVTVSDIVRTPISVLSVDDSTLNTRRQWLPRHMMSLQEGERVLWYDDIPAVEYDTKYYMKWDRAIPPLLTTNHRAFSVLNGIDEYFTIPSLVMVGDFDLTLRVTPSLDDFVVAGDSNNSMVAFTSGGELLTAINGTTISTSGLGVTTETVLHRVRITRVGTSVTVYYDGVSVATGTEGGVFVLTHIGSSTTGTQSLAGIVSDFLMKASGANLPVRQYDIGEDWTGGTLVDALGNYDGTPVGVDNTNVVMVSTNADGDYEGDLTLPVA